MAKVSAPAKSVTLLALFLVLASIGQVQKFLGLAGAGAYAVIVFGVLATGYRFVPAIAGRVTERQASWLAMGTLLVLLACFAVVYPIANSGAVGGGSDREDNLNVATSALLRGQYPYYPVGYLGLPVDVLPGTLLLAIPFVLLGNSAYQNLFWLAAFFVCTRVYLRDGRQALLMLWVMLAASPAVLQELVTGGDLIANSVSVFLFALFLAGSASNPAASAGQKAVAAILFGVGLSSRANFLLIVPLVFSFLTGRCGWRNAVKSLGLAGVTFAAITVPFYVYDPEGFSPMRLQNRFGMFESVLPFARTLIPVATAALALVLSLPRRNATSVDLLRNCALVMAFPVACGIVLSLAKFGTKGLMFAVQGWGLFFLFFGVVAAWSALFREPGFEPPQASGSAG